MWFRTVLQCNYWTLFKIHDTKPRSNYRGYTYNTVTSILTERYVSRQMSPYNGRHWEHSHGFLDTQLQVMHFAQVTWRSCSLGVAENTMKFFVDFLLAQQKLMWSKRKGAHLSFMWCISHRRLTCSAWWIARASSTKLVIVAVVSFPCTKIARH